MFSNRQDDEYNDMEEDMSCAEHGKKSVRKRHKSKLDVTGDCSIVRLAILYVYPQGEYIRM